MGRMGGRRGLGEGWGRVADRVSLWVSVKDVNRLFRCVNRLLGFVEGRLCDGLVSLCVKVFIFQL